jgi:undecaprenyl pyrophosphate synthase
MGRMMKRAAVAGTLVFLVAQPALAQSEKCSAIIDALKKYGERVMQGDAKTPVALCAGYGQISALARSMQEIADKCLEGGPRDSTMKEMAETAKVMQDEIDKSCK